MKASILVLLGIALGCAAGAVGLTPSRGAAQVAVGPAVYQFCTDTGRYNNTEALDGVVKKAGSDGWELVGVYRPTVWTVTQNPVDYVCFRKPH